MLVPKDFVIYGDMKVITIQGKTKLSSLIVRTYQLKNTMNLFLYIQITENSEDVKFNNPIISSIKERNLDLTIYDIDNHSEPFIIGYANKLLSEATKTILLIETNQQSSFPKLMSLLTYVLDNPKGIEIIIKGNNLKLEKMLSIFSNFWVSETAYEIEQIEQLITKFL